MAKKRFIIQYPDGSKKQIGCTERDSLILSKEIQLQAENRYKFTGQIKTFHSLSQLAELIPAIKPSLLRHYLDGSWMWILRGEREEQREETPEACVLRLEAMGWKAGAPA